MSSEPTTDDNSDEQSDQRADEAEMPDLTTDTDEDVIYQTRPTLKPTLLALGLTVAMWVAVVGLLMSNPDLIITEDLTDVVEIVAHLIFAFVALRLLIRLYILSRMSYTVRDGRIIREYSLLYRYRRREVPIQKVRGVEIRRDPVETILGYGTVSVLSGGVDQGLGFLTFDNVPNPDDVASALNDAIGN